MSELHEIHKLDKAGLTDLGRTLRKEVPRRSQASWDPPADRRDPVEILEQSNVSRLPDLVPVRYGRMLESEFTYLRGSPAVMAYDFSHAPVSGIRVQACGDAHLLNFGLFGSPERRLVFDVNDFDETLPAPWEWDVKRLVASFVVAARTGGLDSTAGKDAARAAARWYREGMAVLTQMSPLDSWYAHVDADDLLNQAEDAQNRAILERTMNKARNHDNMQALEKLTNVVNGERRIVSDPPLIVPIPRADPLAIAAHNMFDEYGQTLSPERRALLRQFRVTDAARKVVGVGSVGTRCFIVLGESVVDGSPLFLQLKEAQESVLAPYAGPSEYAHEGERVVQGQRFVQAVSDIFLGWTSSVGAHFYARQLRDMKGSVDLSRPTAPMLIAYARMCGVTLAHAHARSVPPAVIAGYLGNKGVFDDAMTEFACVYAEQNRRDYEALRAAETSGRITAVRNA